MSLSTIGKCSNSVIWDHYVTTTRKASEIPLLVYWKAGIVDYNVQVAECRYCDLIILVGINMWDHLRRAHPAKHSEANAQKELKKRKIESNKTAEVNPINRPDSILIPEAGDGIESNSTSPLVSGTADILKMTKVVKTLLKNLPPNKAE